MGESVYGIVCSARNSGESDRRVVIFGPDCGKISALVRSARKEKSKLAGATRTFCEGRFHVNVSRGRGAGGAGRGDAAAVEAAGTRSAPLLIVSGVELRNSHKKVQSDIRCLAAGSFFLELLESGHWPEDLWEPVFRLTVNALRVLPDAYHHRHLACFVEAKLLKLSGVYPDFSSCAECGRPIVAGAAVVDRKSEHAYHDGCAPLTASGKIAGYETTADVVCALYRLADVALAQYDSGWIGSAPPDSVEKTLWRMLAAMMDAPLKSRRFLEEALGW
ncbi:MAG: DNA repair protein RecO C-terminal domain-containing protein [bacterium]